MLYGLVDAAGKTHDAISLLAPLTGVEKEPEVKGSRFSRECEIHSAVIISRE